MNKFVIPTLLGVTSAALGPTIQSGYPKFGTLVAPATTDQTKDAAHNVLEKYSLKGTATIGPLRGYRNDLVVFPTQKVSKAATAATSDKASVVTQAGTTTTFWQLAKASLGTFFAPVTTTDNASIVSSAADGAGWVVCAALMDYSTCNGGIGVNFKTAGSETGHLIPSRIVLQADSNDNIQVYGKPSTIAYYWNHDLLMASFYHEQWPSTTKVADGTSWCSPFKTTLDAKKTSTLTATQGFYGQTKCTWQFSSTDGTTGPGFMMETASYTNFIIQWTEWITTAVLGTNALLPTADGASHFIGAYPTTNGVQLNPMPKKNTVWTDATWNTGLIEWAHEEKAPGNWPAGSLGAAIYYTGVKGAYQQTGTFTVDSYLLIQNVKNVKKQNEDFERAKRDYIKEKKAYEEAGEEEEARKKDFFKAIFDEQKKLPNRPNVPNLPQALEGPDLNLAKAYGSDALTWQSTADLQKNYAYLVNALGSAGNSPDPKFATRWGTLVATADTTVTDVKKTAAGIGHAFGWLGQGEASTIDGTNPFYWGPNASTDTPTMMLSFFPAADADTGLAATANEITVSAKAKDWLSDDAFQSPTLPSKAQVAKIFAGSAENSTYLALGATTALAAAVTLF